MTGLATAALDYALPEALIATRPAEPRDAARMLIVRASGGDVEHRTVADLPAYLEPRDLLVFNDTAVAPARFLGRRARTGGRVEGLFLEPVEGCWRAMLKPSRRLRPGELVEILAPNGKPTGDVLRLIEHEGRGTWLAADTGDGEALDVLDRSGLTPLPPYILRARAERDINIDDARDRAWYQTVYAGASRGSVAAPTAGLHFTPRLLDALDARGVRRANVTLHVGAGTFLPVTAETLGEHPMHEERIEVPPKTIDALRAMRDEDAGRVIAIGTTTVRTLESLPDRLPSGDVQYAGATDLLIAPPYRFRHVDGMLTNFHLPRSTLLALVAAMLGLERLLAIYAEAVRREYRFYSYGDAMLVLP